jgi:hypothetical protein
VSVFGIEPERFTCSRAACGEPALWRVEWRNPKIHTADRVKVWLACDEHVDYLREFLAARDFPVRVAEIHLPATNTAETNTAAINTGATNTAESQA